MLAAHQLCWYSSTWFSLSVITCHSFHGLKRGISQMSNVQKLQNLTLTSVDEYMNINKHFTFSDWVWKSSINLKSGRVFSAYRESMWSPNQKKQVTTVTVIRVRSFLKCDLKVWHCPILKDSWLQLHRTLHCNQNSGGKWVHQKLIPKHRKFICITLVYVWNRSNWRLEICCEESLDTLTPDLMPRLPS